MNKANKIGLYSLQLQGTISALDQSVWTTKLKIRAGLVESNLTTLKYEISYENRALIQNQKSKDSEDSFSRTSLLQMLRTIKQCHPVVKDFLQTGTEKEKSGGEGGRLSQIHGYIQNC